MGQKVGAVSLLTALCVVFGLIYAFTGWMNMYVVAGVCVFFEASRRVQNAKIEKAAQKS